MYRLPKFFKEKLFQPEVLLVMLPWSLLCCCCALDSLSDGKDNISAQEPVSKLEDDCEAAWSLSYHGSYKVGWLFKKDNHFSFTLKGRDKSCFAIQYSDESFGDCHGKFSTVNESGWTGNTRSSIYSNDLICSKETGEKFTFQISLPFSLNAESYPKKFKTKFHILSQNTSRSRRKLSELADFKTRIL